MRQVIIIINMYKNIDISMADSPIQIFAQTNKPMTLTLQRNVFATGPLNL